jgi:hypothetical protein
MLAAAPAMAADAYQAWARHFYENQDFASFDGYWQMVIKKGLLADPVAANPVVGFSSQVFHRYPALMKGRVDRPAAFPPPARPAVEKILWLSDTVEGNEILKSFGSTLAPAKPPAAVNTWHINSDSDLDVCWGWYFASGDVTGLKPIVAVLDLGKNPAALKRFPRSRPIAGEGETVAEDPLFCAALWSLGENAPDDPRIAKYLQVCFSDPKASARRKAWLSLLIRKASPEFPLGG